MEINTNPSIKTNLTGLTPAVNESSSNNVKPASVVSRPALAVTQADNAPLGGLDGELNIPDSVLDTNDKLGQLVQSAFNLPAPPMVKAD
ncbi:MAG: hypothetical protein IJJ33_12965 [Victivallales bacterium]|nr:hypothetical protein [Victivallales bacterium]